MVAGILITDKKAELRVRKSSLLLICDFGKSEDGFYLNAPACAIMPIETAVFGLRNQGNQEVKPWVSQNIFHFFGVFIETSRLEKRASHCSTTHYLFQYANRPE